MADGKWIIGDLGQLLLDAVIGAPDICETCCETGHCNCNIGNVSDPRMKVTLSWDDDSTSKEMFSCTWANGETKEICPVTYINSGSQELWSQSRVDPQGFTNSTASGIVSAIGCTILATARTTTSTVAGSTTTVFNSFQREHIEAIVGVTWFSGSLVEQQKLRKKFFKRGAPSTSTATTSTVSTGITAENIPMSGIQSVFGAMGLPSIQEVQFGQMTAQNPNNGFKYTLKWERLPRADANPNILTTTTITPDYWEASAP
jgi:hypothetical protein